MKTFQGKSLRKNIDFKRLGCKLTIHEFEYAKTANLLSFSYDKAYYPEETINAMAAILFFGVPIPPTYNAGFDTKSTSLKLGKVA